MRILAHPCYVAAGMTERGADKIVDHVTTAYQSNAAPRDAGLFRALQDDGSIDPAVDPKLAPDLLLRAYREIKRLRLLDARMILLQRQGRIGFYGACTGQEATPIATALAMQPEDWVFPALRESSIML